MAAVLTRFLPSSTSRLLSRQPRSDPLALNENAHNSNSAIAIDLQPDRQSSDMSHSLGADIVPDEQEVDGSPTGDGDYEPAADEGDLETVHQTRTRTRGIHGGPPRRTSGRTTLKNTKSPSENEESDERKDEDNTSDISENTSAAEEQWEAETDAEEEVEVEIANPNRCMLVGGKPRQCRIMLK